MHYGDKIPSLLTQWNCQDFIGLAAHLISGHSNLHANAYPWQAVWTLEEFFLHRVKSDTSIESLLFCVRDGDMNQCLYYNLLYAYRLTSDTFYVQTNMVNYLASSCENIGEASAIS